MSETINASRERILGRITQALRRPREIPAVSAGPVFSPVGELLPKFELECRNNGTGCIVTDSFEGTRSVLAKLLAEISAGEIFAQDSPEIRAYFDGISRELNWTVPTQSCQATITSVEGLIADTGSLLLSSRCGGRRGSVVAPVHIAIARESQLLPDLQSAMKIATQLARESSFVCVTTGCSRTADIEKLLVIGAHGPKRLVVIVQRD